MRRAGIPSRSGRSPSASWSDHRRIVHCESGHAPQILEEILDCVKEHFPVAFDHATIQLETAALRDLELPAIKHA